MKSRLLMTWSLTLAGLQLLDATSTPLYYKRKVQKMKDLPKTWFLTENQFEDFRLKKEQKQYARPFRKKPNRKQRNLQVSIDQTPRKQ